ncbi:sn-glycerol-3-phosphate ABC transporter ATP-binding protein UgpC [Pseudovibrio exalbescens]|uniref:ABC transporter ATP-binding protein n=1 Tax=Pseudovibrio exalbescens TaxID=197461 RepID=UPI0023650C5D|nr:sn-glycerol-3-phosphate ABC transporter ATP-binding protein UgpC [Pseudovibrio exalbescens]MDD7910794.1 sn-glycerol-3-phosphate ABC transporter ATP-binding protein UgpC [Pseudovibrio exalbescens]
MTALAHAAGIHLVDLQKTYSKTPVIPGLTADLASGEFTVILGPSGCGKSTLLNMIAGLEKVSGGKIMIGSREVQDIPPKDRGLAMVFQNYALYPHMSVADNIGYALKVAGVPKDERTSRIQAAANVVNLGDYLDRRPSELSGGQRQRVAIARAIVREPQVLLFDEPLSNLDAKLRHDMRMELSSLHRRIGATSVFVTHDQVEAMTLADRILILNHGRIQQFDTPNNIYHKPANTFVAGFIGSPPMNLVEAQASNGAVSVGGVRLAATETSGDVTVGIRPEHIKVTESGIPVHVAYREDLGSHSTMVVEMENGQTLRLATQLGEPIRGGEWVHITIPEDKLHFFDAATGDALRSD